MKKCNKEPIVFFHSVDTIDIILYRKRISKKALMRIKEKSKKMLSIVYKDSVSAFIM